MAARFSLPVPDTDKHPCPDTTKHPSSEANKIAGERLNTGEMTFSDTEIDKFLPEKFRSTTKPVCACIA